MRTICKALLATFAFFTCTLTACRAQFIGYVSPQTVQTTLATNVACTGTTQDFTTGITAGFSNLGQTQHYAFITYSAPPQSALVVIQGIDAAGNATVISDAMQGQPSVTGLSAVLVGLGYFPQIRIRVICSTAGAPTFSITYMGASSTAFVPQGSQIATAVDKVLLSGFSAGSNGGSQTATPPFGNSSGVLIFKYSGGSGPAGSSLSVSCFGSTTTTSQGSGQVQTFTYPIAQIAAQQLFAVPASPCPFYAVNYNSGGASANTFNLEYVFSEPGLPNPSTQYSHITGTTATAVKTTPGFVHTLSINTGAAGTVSIFDLPAASCTGTPATNQVAVITSTATTLQTFTYDVNLLQGICVKASVAMDLTVSFQ